MVRHHVSMMVDGIYTDFEFEGVLGEVGKTSLKESPVINESHKETTCRCRLHVVADVKEMASLLQLQANMP